MVVSAVGSYSVSMLGVVSSFLRLVKALSCVGVQSQVFFALKSSCNGLDNSAMFGENLPSWFTIPRNLRSSETDFSVSICYMTAVLLGSVVMLLWSMTCPRNIWLVLQNLHFLLLSVMPPEERCFSTAWSRLLCLVRLCQKWECHP